jgi:hypothetical protein
MQDLHPAELNQQELSLSARAFPRGAGVNRSTLPTITRGFHDFVMNISPMRVFEIRLRIITPITDLR